MLAYLKQAYTSTSTIIATTTTVTSPSPTVTTASTTATSVLDTHLTATGLAPSSSVSSSISNIALIADVILAVIN